MRNMKKLIVAFATVLVVPMLALGVSVFAGDSVSAQSLDSGIGAAQATITGKLADSAKIARNASTIAMISDKTPEEIEADGAECGNKKLRVTVNRNGMQMTQDEYIDLLFDGNHILYEQAKQHIPQTPF